MSVSASRSRAGTGGDAVLAALIEEMANRFQAGEPVDVEAYLREHPAEADQLRDILPALQALAELGRSAAAGETSVPPTGAEVGLERQTLGDFRIVREVGRGGMGVVFEAEQISLGRRVALKVLPFAAALDARQLQRFKNEAQAAARLHDTNIVPVHAVGCERGMHFYAMQFIEGHTLAAVIGALRQMRSEASEWWIEKGGPKEKSPAGGAATLHDQGGQAETRVDHPLSFILPPRSASPAPPSAFFRTAAQLGVQAAEALDYAHRQEVVHRDIKPANLMVDGQGNLWVTDFGLALFPSDVGLTMTGELLGTLRYMSPEQALGRRAAVDHRTDVYSLGATLYELLTLEPAVPGSDRREVLRQIEWDEPRRLRRLNRAVPPELEVIVRKAMAKDPAERYATAQELADDLRRFLEDKPIRARRPTLGQVAAKWARRHRGVVVTAAVAVVVGLVLGMTGLVLSYLRIHQEKAQAEADQKRADQTLTLAIEALDSICLRLAEERFPRDPRWAQENRELLALALRCFQTVARDNDTDPRARRWVALAYLRLGYIQAFLGQHGLAREAYERGLALSAQLAAERPADYEVHKALAAGHDRLAKLLMHIGDHPAATFHYRQTVEVWSRLAADFPAVTEVRSGLAEGYNNLGLILAADGAWTQAEGHYRQALALEEQLAADFPTDAYCRGALAATCCNLAIVMAETGKDAEAETWFRQSLDHFSRLAATWPRHGVYQQLEARASRNLAALLAVRDRQAAKPFYQRALAIQAQLIKDFPAVPEFRHGGADTLNQLGTLLADQGERASAAEHFRQARDLAARLAADFPAVPDYRRLLAAVHSNLGKLALETGRWSEGEAEYQQALRILTRLAAAAPNVPGRREGLAGAHHNQGYILEGNGNREGAEAQHVHALAIRTRLAADFPSVPRYRAQLASTHEWLGRLRHARGATAEAADHIRRATALWTELGTDPRPGEAGKGDRGMALNAHARFLATCPDPQWRDPEQAVELARKAVVWAPTNGVYSATLGMAYYRAGQLQEALDSLERAGRFRNGRDSAEGFFLAMIHGRLGARDQARQWFDASARTMETRQPGSELLRRLRAEAAAELGIDRPPFPKGKDP
jgi:serine/threonine protein kinase